MEFDDFEEFALTKEPIAPLRAELPSEQGPTTDDKVQKKGMSDENVGKCIDVVKTVVDMGTIQMQTDAMIKQQEENRKTIMAQAEAYVKAKAADCEIIKAETDDKVRQLEQIRLLLREFGDRNNVTFTGDQLANIVDVSLKNINNK